MAAETRTSYFYNYVYNQCHMLVYKLINSTIYLESIVTLV